MPTRGVELATQVPPTTTRTKAQHTDAHSTSLYTDAHSTSLFYIFMHGLFKLAPQKDENRAHEFSSLAFTLELICFAALERH